jgi:MarR family 2-MHQ and catechol resistance regulon transcriptional repressor
MSFLCEFDRAHSRFQLMLEQSLDRWGITSSQFRMLNTLVKKDRFQPKELATLLEIDVAASTRLIDRLVSKNMVERIRCKEDRRKCFVSISSGFKKEVQDIIEHEKRVEDFFLEGVSSEHRESFQIAINELAKLKKYRSGETGQSVIF